VDDLRILTDPILRDGLGPVRRQVRTVLPDLFANLDAVFISHGHHDHLAPASLRQIPGRPTVIVPRGFGRLVSRLDLGPVEEVEPGDRLTIDRVHFSVVEALHSGRREPFGPVGPAIGCVIGGSRTVYFAGETDLFPGMDALAGSLDLALLPVWGWGPTIGEGHMDPERAAQAAAVLPRLAVPIHWGTCYPAGLRRVVPVPFESPGPAFAKAAARLAPDVPVRIRAPGESIDLPAR
jgi:L-ascorbate metabolism protein UlaG (beta-lactamase superfamily)